MLNNKTIYDKIFTDESNKEKFNDLKYIDFILRKYCYFSFHCGQEDDPCHAAITAAL